uniref:Uncharacterized protein n=1 Tax=Aureoumbra lagunensis TaxID=44058 RepID=A0A7S3NH19_9STRA|mmetsp:Transcript_7637/g.11485  ORF Transcript_7637/g.11485 Transcript_7637/m.11485 type:complete len:352 (+) Transcript_7637:61-1116(+)
MCRLFIFVVLIASLEQINGLVVRSIAPKYLVKPPSAVWSDSRATLDYQNLLDGKVPEEKSDGPSVVIGDDPLGIALAKLAPSEPDPVVSVNNIASELTSALSSRPSECAIYVSIAQPQALSQIIEACPEERREDLCFINYGDMVENDLKRYNCCRDYQTQAVAYYAINEFNKIEDDRCLIGDDAMGQPKYAAETCVTGKWAGAYASRLTRNDLFCSTVFYRDFRRQMLERVTYESTYNLVSCLHKRVPIAEVPDFFRDECDDMIYEIFRLLRGNLAVALLSGAEERLAAYARAQRRSKQDDKLPYLSASSPYRNRFFYDVSMQMKQRGFPDPAPTHTEYFEYGLENDLFDP